MADDLKKNLRKLGVTDAEFAKAMADSTAQMKEQEALAKKLTNRFETLTQNLREQGAIASQLNGNTLERKLIAEAIKETEGDITRVLHQVLKMQLEVCRVYWGQQHWQSHYSLL
jgi:hypothetical protein